MAIIDATNLVLGRLCAIAAKRAMLGEKIEIVNCENALVSGSRNYTVSHYVEKFKRGNTFNGPFFPKESGRVVKRTIRGMVPYRKAHGDAAMRRVFCYSGTPIKLAGKETESIPAAHIKGKNIYKYTKLSDLSGLMGARQ